MHVTARRNFVMTQTAFIVTPTALPLLPLYSYYTKYIQDCQGVCASFFQIKSPYFVRAFLVFLYFVYIYFLIENQNCVFYPDFIFLSIDAIPCIKHPRVDFQCNVWRDVFECTVNIHT